MKFHKNSLNILDKKKSENSSFFQIIDSLDLFFYLLVLPLDSYRLTEIIKSRHSPTCGNERMVLADRAWMPGFAMSAMPIIFWRAWSFFSESGTCVEPCGLGLFLKPRRESRLASIPAITCSRFTALKWCDDDEDDDDDDGDDDDDDDDDVFVSMRRPASVLAFALASSKVTAATSTNLSSGDMRIVTSSLTWRVTSLKIQMKRTLEGFWLNSEQ